jgi:hypothetical protein
MCKTGQRTRKKGKWQNEAKVQLHLKFIRDFTQAISIKPGIKMPGDSVTGHF